MRSAIKGFLFLSGLILLLPEQSLRADSMIGALHLGIPVSSDDARGRALGGASSAIGGEDFSFNNPARLVNFWRAGINGTFSQDYITLKTPEGSSNLRATEYLSLNAVFPAYKKFVLSWGLHQDRDMTWTVSDRKTYDFMDSGEASRLFSSTGSFYVSRLSLARTVSSHLALGMSADWLIGKSDREREIDFGSDDLVKTIDRFNYRYSCVRPTFGVLGAYKGFNAALSYTLSKTAKVKKTVLTNGGVSLKESLEQDLASAWRLGASYRFASRFTVSTDYEVQNWDGIAVLPDSRVRSVDQWRWGIGLEVHPSTSDSPSLYRKIPWRFGYSRAAYPFEISGNPVRESIFAIGSGLYVSKNAGLVDVTLEMGKRSIDAPGYPEESVTRLVISVSAFERWVSRPKRK